MCVKKYKIESEDEMIAAGERLSGSLKAGDLIYLEGALGAGKTTFVKGVLSGLGFTGHVTSPTYTLVETYWVNQLSVFHFDLYRLKESQELEMIGVRDMIGPESISLIEWPDKGQGVLLAPNISIQIQYQKVGRLVRIQHH